MAGQSQPNQTLHALIRLQEYGGMLIAQPYNEQGIIGQTLTFDYQSGKLALADAADQIKGSYLTAYGIMGVVRLRSGSVLVAVTGARKVRPVTLVCTHG